MRKKKKLKSGVSLILVILIVALFAFMLFTQNKENYNSVKSKYSDEANIVAEKHGIEDKLLQYPYSKTLEVILESDNFKKEYFDKYMDVLYVEEEAFINNVNTLLGSKYSADEINKIFKLSTRNQDLFLEKKLNNFIEYVDEINFNATNIDRYNAYKDLNKDYNVSEIVTFVNLNLDKKFYEVNYEIKYKDSVDVLVNKYNSLTKEFVPKDIVSLTNFAHVKMRKDAANKFEEMVNAAKDDGFIFEPTTAYRNANFQNILYTNYVKKDGKDAADTYSARPGNSEHQTGLVVDIKNPEYYSKTNIRLNEEDYKWILDNAHKFGYIVRYPKDKTYITGYIEEPWHLRYLGVDLATKVIESNLTFDEYYDKYLVEY